MHSVINPSHLCLKLPHHRVRTVHNWEQNDLYSRYKSQASNPTVAVQRLSLRLANLETRPGRRQRKAVQRPVTLQEWCFLHRHPVLVPCSARARKGRLTPLPGRRLPPAPAIETVTHSPTTVTTITTTVTASRHRYRHFRHASSPTDYYPRRRPSTPSGVLGDRAGTATCYPARSTSRRQW